MDISLLDDVERDMTLLRDLYSTEIAVSRAENLIETMSVDLAVQAERIAGTTTGYIYYNDDYRTHTLNPHRFIAFSSWVNRTAELGLPREPWKWGAAWHSSKSFWQKHLHELATYGFSADASVAMSDENCVLRMFYKIGHGVQTMGFEVSKLNGQRVVDVVADHQHELDSTIDLPSRVDHTLQFAIADLTSGLEEEIDWH